MIARPTAKKCSNCSHIDRESYKPVKTNVCYLIEKKDGEAVAVAVTDRTAACGYWRAEK